jgi:hypothetical protein
MSAEESRGSPTAGWSPAIFFSQVRLLKVQKCCRSPAGHINSSIISGHVQPRLAHITSAIWTPPRRCLPLCRDNTPKSWSMSVSTLNVKDGAAFTFVFTDPTRRRPLERSDWRTRSARESARHDLSHHWEHGLGHDDVHADRRMFGNVQWHANAPRRRESSPPCALCFLHASGHSHERRRRPMALD